MNEVIVTLVIKTNATDNHEALDEAEEVLLETGFSVDDIQSLWIRGHEPCSRKSVRRE